MICDELRAETWGFAVHVNDLKWYIHQPRIIDEMCERGEIGELSREPIYKPVNWVGGSQVQLSK